MFKFPDNQLNLYKELETAGDSKDRSVVEKKEPENDDEPVERKTINVEAGKIPIEPWEDRDDMYRKHQK